MTDKQYRNLNITLKILLAFGCILCAMVVGGIRVKADCGPKPSIILVPENAPEHYYVALLTNDRWNRKTYTTEQNSELKLESVSEKSVEAYLENFYYDGWGYLWANGSHHSYRRSNEKEVYFSCNPIANPFRVLIIGEDGTVYISEEHTKKEFDAECNLDVSTGVIVERQYEQQEKLVKSFFYVIGCYIVTIVVEFLALMLFGYLLTKRNLLSFFFINTVTNIPLCCCCLSMGSKPWFNYLFFMLVAESIVTLVEGIFFAFMLRDKNNEVRPKRGIVYAVVANLVSASMSFVSIGGPDFLR